MTNKKWRIFVTQPILPEGLEILERVAEVRQNDRGRPLTEDEMVEVARTFEADAYIGVFAEPNRVFSGRVIEASKSLKVIAWNGLSYEHIDLEAATKRGIHVTFVDSHCPTVSDHAFALLLTAARRIIPAHLAVQAGRWEREGILFNLQFMGNEVHHKTIGVVGAGRIGSGIVKRAAGFDMRILYHDTVRRPDLEQAYGAEAVPFEILLKQSDFVCCSLPLIPQTQNMFDRAAFAAMKRDAIFINVSRGGCVDTDALYEALKNRTIEMAAIDVIAPEPLPSDHPILKLDNAIVMPHIAGLARDTRVQSQIQVAKDAIAVLEGIRPPLIMNPKAELVRPLRAP